MRASARDHVLTRSLLVVVVALGLVCPGTARAGDVEAARRTFGEGVHLYQRGDYEGARRLFRQADAEHHAAPIVYNLGLAEERLGHLQAAVDAYEAYVAEVGDAGSLSSPATIAIAQIKARATKLRIDTQPPGARIFVDGSPLVEPAPAVLLVPAGHHVLVAQGHGWRAERDVEVRGTGDSFAVTLEAPKTDEPPSSAPPLAPVVAPIKVDRVESPPAPSPAPRTPDGLVLGASFAIAPYFLLGVDNPSASNARPARSIIAGPMLEVGIALSDRMEFLAKGWVALGPDGKPTYAYMGGPGLSFRATKSAWFGATFIGGQLETDAHGARYGTDLVFGAMFEAAFVVLSKDYGDWMAWVQPGFLLTEMRNDNTAFFVPFSFGLRTF